MTDAELDALEKLAEKATPGPWYAKFAKIFHADGRAEHQVRGPIGIVATVFYVPGDEDGRSVSDCELMAASRAAVPALIAELRKAKTLLKRIEWGGTEERWDQSRCPVCDEPSYSKDGHASDCELAVLIK